MLCRLSYVGKPQPKDTNCLLRGLGRPFRDGKTSPEATRDAVEIVEQMLKIPVRMAPRRPDTRTNSPSGKAKRGQSLVETAIALPVILLLSLGVIDLGRSFYYREAVTNSVRQSLRMAVSQYQQSAANNVCSTTSSGPVAATVTSPIPPSGGALTTIANQAALESSSNGAPAGSVIKGGSLSVTFHCLNGVGVTNATSNGNGPSDPGSDTVSASITFRMNIVTPLLWPLVGSSVPITVTSSERTEY